MRLCAAPDDALPCDEPYVLARLSWDQGRPVPDLDHTSPAVQSAAAAFNARQGPLRRRTCAPRARLAAPLRLTDGRMVHGALSPEPGWSGANPPRSRLLPNPVANPCLLLLTVSNPDGASELYVAHHRSWTGERLPQGKEALW